MQGSRYSASSPAGVPPGIDSLDRIGFILHNPSTEHRTAQMFHPHVDLYFRQAAILWSLDAVLDRPDALRTVAVGASGTIIQHEDNMERRY